MYLKELAKEYKKRNKNVPAELILVGGASVLINYGFREMTTDIDAITSLILWRYDKYEYGSPCKKRKIF